MPYRFVWDCLFQNCPLAFKTYKEKFPWSNFISDDSEIENTKGGNINTFSNISQLIFEQIICINQQVYHLCSIMCVIDSLLNLEKDVLQFSGHGRSAGYLHGYEVRNVTAFHAFLRCLFSLVSLRSFWLGLRSWTFSCNWGTNVVLAQLMDRTWILLQNIWVVWFSNKIALKFLYWAPGQNCY